MLEAQLKAVKEQILENDRRVRPSAREAELGRRLIEISGMGPLPANTFEIRAQIQAMVKTRS